MSGSNNVIITQLLRNQVIVPAFVRSEMSNLIPMQPKRFLGLHPSDPYPINYVNYIRQILTQKLCTHYVLEGANSPDDESNGVHIRAIRLSKINASGNHTWPTTMRYRESKTEKFFIGTSSLRRVVKTSNKSVIICETLNSDVSE